MSYNPYPPQQGYNPPPPQSHPLPPNPNLNQGYSIPNYDRPPISNYPPPVMNSGPPPAPYGGPTAPYGKDDRGRGSSGPPVRYGGGGGDRREMSPGELLFHVSQYL